MATAAIFVEDLGKRYRIGETVRYRALRYVLAGTIRPPLKRTKSRSSTNDVGTIWALKNVGFEINQGDSVGIIGRNGAGKSTLLKILSRITEPTTGHARIRGRLASLLEVG